MDASSPHPTGSKTSALDVTPRFTTTSHTYAREAYRGVVSDEEVETLLHDEDIYDSSQKRWSFPFGTEDLLHNIYDICQHIVKRLVLPKVSGVGRMVLSTETTPGCDMMNEDGYRVCPMLLVRATGPSFEIPDSAIEPDGITPSSDAGTSVGFANIATYFALRMEKDPGSEEDLVKEMKSYARTIFCSQPNRLYVRSLVVTEQHARLVHIDRGGAEITPPIDIHQDPGTLVRVVAGLSSTNERQLGIDDSIQWDIVNEVKAQGTLITTDSCGLVKKFRILEQIPIPHESISGCGTTCWRVQDPDTLEEYILKDGWRPDFLIPEHELLKLAKGAAGVAQLVSYETGRGQIQDFRCPTTSGQYHNLIASRTTTKAYGKSIACFTSILQPLHALRDAIAGHQRLCGDDVRILHRDISHNNVLLGRDGAPDGERGILIDFDLAFRATDAVPAVLTNRNIGTRLFQSVSVLEGSLTHDHIDELESFFYLLAYILLLFKPDGTPVPRDDKGPLMVWAWGVDDTEEVIDRKRSFRTFGTEAIASRRLIQESWGPVCGLLLHKFRRWVLRMADKKSDIFEDHRGEDTPEVFYSRRDDHYASVLCMFDTAIDEITATISSPSKTSPNPAATLPDAPVTDGPQLPIAGFHEPADIAPLPITPDSAVQPPLSPLSTNVATPQPPAPVGALSPIFLLSRVLPAVPALPRRSSRIQDVCLQKTRQCLAPAANAGGLKRITAAAPALPAATEPRRSARIRKRCLEEEQADAPKPKVRRTIKGSRRTTRSR